MPFVNVEGKAFEVIADNYVTADDGTGIVHIAPIAVTANLDHIMADASIIHVAIGTAITR